MPTWLLFLRCQWQWRWRDFGEHRVRDGLDYSACEIVMARSGIPSRQRDEAFALLQAMETAAIRGSYERAKRVS